MAEGSKKCFLIMPFQDKLEWLRRLIVDAGESIGVDVVRADDVFAPGSILQQILKTIDESDVVVCVCTERNANVFFELGYAWQKHSPVLLAQDSDNLPSDFSHYRTIIYGEPSPDTDVAKIKGEVVKHMQSVLADSPPGSTLSKEVPEADRGVVLVAPPTPKSRVRMSLRYSSGRKGNDRLVLGNTGTIDLHEVNVVIPEAVAWLHLFTNDLPIEVMRPGEQVELLAAASMGGGPRIFDALVTGRTPDGEDYSKPIKLSS